MFDPSKLDVDFSDTSDLNTIKERKEKKEAEIKEKEEKVDDILLDLVDDDTSKSSDNKEEDVIELDLGQNTDTDLLSTIITDNELVQKNKVLKEAVEKKEAEQINKEINSDKILFDINLKSINDVIGTILREQHDYVTIEPNEDYAKVSFIKDEVTKEVIYIKYIAYTNLIISLKNVGKLKLEITDKEQKGKSEYDYIDKRYTTFIKTKPSNFGEKVFFKIQETSKIGVKKKKEKLSLGKIIWFLVALLFTALIIGGVFLGFILFNSNTVADLKFFNDLGIDVGKVRDFVANLVNIIFFMIVFIETIFAIVYIFKAILTKKAYKKKKTGAIILAIFLLIITIATGFIWLSLSKKVLELKGLNYGKPIVYDNSLLISKFYESADATIVNTEDQLIGPITLKFDVSEYLQKLKDDGNTPTKLIWTFGNNEEIEKPAESYEMIREFASEGLNEVFLDVEITNLKGEKDTIRNEIANIDISYNIEVNFDTLSNGGKTVQFDASSLKNLGEIEWYYIPDLQGKDESEKQKVITEALNKPSLEGYVYSPQTVIFDDEIIIGMHIKKKDGSNTKLDKIFVVSGDGQSDIEGSIKTSPSLKSDLTYNLWISDVDNSFGNGFLKSVTWKIGDKEINKEIDIVDIESSSKIEYSFKEYGKHKVIVSLIDANDNIKILEDTISIAKTLKLKKGLSIYNIGTTKSIGRYNKKTFEYSINDLATPTTIDLDARFVSPANQLYALQKVEWDLDADGSADETGTQIEHTIETVGNHRIIVKYIFVHRKLSDSIIEMTENIYIDSVKKESILDLQIEKESNYAPIVVRFDASRSEVKGDDIEKFIYDYGDGTPLEERDAINPGHKYLEPGNYVIKLTVKTKKGKTYSIEKDLNLIEKPSEIVISTSLKRTSIWQDIVFSSDKSNGQITSYFWNFGDGKISTEANPVHAFDKAGEYTVKLTGTFINNNVEYDEVTIKVEK